MEPKTPLGKKLHQLRERIMAANNRTSNLAQVFEATNLDGLWPEDLELLAATYSTLAAYAKTKARAMRDRSAGEIEDASKQERQCEALYDKLPDFAQW